MDVAEFFGKRGVVQQHRKNLDTSREGKPPFPFDVFRTRRVFAPAKNQHGGMPNHVGMCLQPGQSRRGITKVDESGVVEILLGLNARPHNLTVFVAVAHEYGLWPPHVETLRSPKESMQAVGCGSLEVTTRPNPVTPRGACTCRRTRPSPRLPPNLFWLSILESTRAWCACIAWQGSLLGREIIAR